MACPVLSYPARGQRVFLNYCDMLIECSNKLDRSIRRTAIYNDDLFVGVFEAHQRLDAITDGSGLVSDGQDYGNQRNVTAGPSLRCQGRKVHQGTILVASKQQDEE